MRKVSQHIKKILVLVISLQILNTGLFAQDFPVATNNQNIINSVTEYIAEVVMKKVDFLPEHLKHNKQTHHKNSNSFLFKVQQFNLFKHNFSNPLFAFKENIKEKEYTISNSIRLQNIVFDITPPPPKA